MFQKTAMKVVEAYRGGHLIYSMQICFWAMVVCNHHHSRLSIVILTTITWIRTPLQTRCVKVTDRPSLLNMWFSPAHLFSPYGMYGYVQNTRLLWPKACVRGELFVSAHIKFMNCWKVDLAEAVVSVYCMHNCCSFANGYGREKTEPLLSTQSRVYVDIRRQNTFVYVSSAHHGMWSFTV